MRSAKRWNATLYAVALHFMFSNYCRPHMTLSKARNGVHTTPAMAAGIADRVWTVEDLLGLMAAVPDAA
ncbi:hypothetical protein BH24GEM2_BH24GEM2_08010 [soil metagenome]